MNAICVLRQEVARRARLDFEEGNVDGLALDGDCANDEDDEDAVAVSGDESDNDD